MDYFVLAALWILWCTIHSGMISLVVTDYLKKKLASLFRFYRLFYNFVALGTLVPLFLYTRAIAGQVLFCWEGNLLISRVIFLVICALLAIFGGRHYDVLQLIGIRQIKTGMSYNTLSKVGEPDTTGILGLTRHPWYLASIILLWSVFQEIYVSILIMNIILTGYIVVGTVLEEKKLIAEYGDAYRRYQESVSMLIPFKWMAARFRK
ncbi:MAG: hypothetical protein JRJ20_08965 [Deltaproteobacteria bacterium]|nr:hypothetical protein [Deltaproteobacteria bacterium]